MILESRLGDDVEAEVAPSFGPLVVLFGEDGANEADEGGAVGAAEERQPAGVGLHRAHPGPGSPGAVGVDTRGDQTGDVDHPAERPGGVRRAASLHTHAEDDDFVGAFRSGVCEDCP